MAGLRLGRALGGLAEALLHDLERSRAEKQAERHALHVADRGVSHEGVVDVGPVRAPAEDVPPVQPIAPPARPPEAAEQPRPTPTPSRPTIRPEVASPETPRASVFSRLGSWIARLGAAAARPLKAAPVVVPPTPLSPERPAKEVREDIAANPRAPAPAVRTEPVVTPPQVAAPTLSSARRDLLLNGEEVRADEYRRRLQTLRAEMKRRGHDHLAEPLDSAIEAAERLPPDERVRALDPFRRAPGEAPVIAAKERHAAGREPPRFPAAR